VRGHVRGEDLHQAIGEVHRPLAAVLWRADLHLTARGAVHLAGDGQRAAQEIDVSYLEGGGLAEPQPSKCGHHDERAPCIRRLAEQGAHLRRGGQRHRRFGTAYTRERDAVAGVGRDHPVTDGGHRSGLQGDGKFSGPLTLRGDAPNGGECAMGPPEVVYQGSWPPRP